jgi:hypothetical protein
LRYNPTPVNEQESRRSLYANGQKRNLPDLVKPYAFMAEVAFGFRSRLRQHADQFDVVSNAFPYLSKKGRTLCAKVAMGRENEHKRSVISAPGNAGQALIEIGADSYQVSRTH